MFKHDIVYAFELLIISRTVREINDVTRLTVNLANGLQTESHVQAYRPTAWRSLQPRCVPAAHSEHVSWCRT